MTLAVTDLTCVRGWMPVLEGVSFTVEAGRTLILRGPNGIGKTTLLRTIAGLQPPEAGRIEGAGDRVAYASHANGLKGALTVEENLAFWAGVYGASEERIKVALKAFDLWLFPFMLAQDLSAGQKRRLSLARLLLTGRPVWLLDEPTVSMDAASVGLFAEAVKGHCAEGGSALIATHIDLGLEADALDLTPYKAAPVWEFADKAEEEEFFA